MIRSDSEYREAMLRIKSEKQGLADHEVKLREMGFSPEQISAGMAPLLTFHEMFVEEAEEFARSRKRDLTGFDSLRDLGRLLVAARIALKLSGRALAKKLNVDESQVSRDERNEYRGITVERACDILDSLEVEVKLSCRLSAVNREICEDYSFDLPAQQRYDHIEFDPGSCFSVFPSGKPPRAAA